MYLAQLDLVPGEMHDAGRYRHPGFHADGRQETREKFSAARHVVERELRAVAMHPVVFFADVARVVEQRGDQRHDCALGAEAVRRIDRHLVTDQETRHGERHVERMLAVVVNRVDAVIAGHAAGEQTLEFVKCDRDPVERLARPGGGE
jgi:hypothetical protein